MTIMATQLPNFTPMASKDEMLLVANRMQDITSPAAIGERIAMMILSDSPETLAEKVEKFSDDEGNQIVDLLASSHDELESRLDLVRTAMARLSATAKRQHNMPKE